MAIYRKPSRDMWEAYTRFAKSVFEKKEPGIDFPSLIPKVYDQSVDSSQMHFIAEDERGIVALVGVQPCSVRVGKQTLKTGFVGTVSVSEAARGEGHMKALMKLQMEDMYNNGTDIAFLSGLRQRYEYFGFAKGGVCHTFTLTNAAMRHAFADVDTTGVTFEEILPGSALEARALSLHETQPVAFDRARYGFALCGRTFNHKPYAAMKNGELIGTLTVSEKPRELGEVEAPTVPALRCMIKAWIAAHNLTEVTFPLPDTNCELVRYLNTVADRASIGPSTQVHIFRYSRVIKAYLTEKARYARLADGILALDIEGERFTIRVKNNHVSVDADCNHPLCLNDLEATMLLTYPFEYTDRPFTPYNWFPLPVYISEADAF